jgi:hypothetical protein
MWTLPILSGRGGGLSLLMTALGLAGCGHPVQRQLEGAWLGEGVENVADAQLAAATGWARGTRLEFTGDNLKVTIPAHDARSGRYKVARVSDADVVLQVPRADGQVDNLKLVLEGGQTLRWQLGEGRSLIMRREE